jgi:DNA-directed RNA polymerase specialized sigma24 family protein
MGEVTQILKAITEGDPGAASQMLPLVYDELRQLAAHRLAQQTPGQTLQPTALVHEAYLRLVGDPQGSDWDNRGHFSGLLVVQLRYFAGLSIPEAARTLGVSPRTANRIWAFARGWLLREVGGGSDDQ